MILNPNILYKIIVYEPIYDDVKSLSQIRNIIYDLNPDVIIRSGRFNPFHKIWIESSADIERIKDHITEIKRVKPNIQLIATMVPYYIHHNEINWNTGESYNETTSYNQLAIDPARWGIIAPTKYTFQHHKEKMLLLKRWYADPDICAPIFRSKIDAFKYMGYDGIWFDLPFVIANIVKTWVNNDETHPAFITCRNAETALCDYAKSVGMYIGSWGLKNHFDIYNKFDFMTRSPGPIELRREFDELKWDETIRLSEEYNIKLIAFLDFGPNCGHSLEYLAEQNPTEARNILEKVDTYFKSRNIDFAFPVFGGYLPCVSITKGTYELYDSQAPEFQTYDTIKKLINPCLQPTCAFIIEE